MKTASIPAFALVALAREMQVDSARALRDANERFVARVRPQV